MKIVQSFWSKPALNPDDINDGALKRGTTGGWLDVKSYYRSWALSCLRFKQYYDAVELVTDTRGKEILIDLLGLPYTFVRTDLDCLANQPTDLWAFGKIYAYSLQKEPFMHVDSDIYIWKRLTQLDGASLIVQNLERHTYFNEILKKYYAVFPFFPDCLRNQVNSNESVWAVNAGIMGGTNYTFINQYAQQAIEFITKNQEFLSRIPLVEFNLIFEQILFFYLTQRLSEPVTSLFDETISQYDRWIVNFDDVPNGTKYIHAVGPYKRDPAITSWVEHCLLADFPEYHNRIERNIK